jgi:hypothetical protein
MAKIINVIDELDKLKKDV